MIAVNDIPYHVITSSTFTKFIDDFNTNFKIPSDKTLSKDMKAFAQEINKETLDKLNGQFVSLLLDGAKRIGIEYESIIIYTPQRLYFYPFSVIPRSTANFWRIIKAN